MQAREDINLDGEEATLNYDCERKPLKMKNEVPKEIDFMSELARGRFAMTANINHNGHICAAKIFDKSDPDGDEAAKREFKNLKSLKHQRLVGACVTLVTFSCFATIPWHRLIQQFR